MKVIILIFAFALLIFTLGTLNKREGFDKRDTLMNACGLPKNYGPTSHCFADSTHQTCCMLGPEARAYADRSGNPIGKASERAFKEANNRDPRPDELTPWCTCFGSKVCSYYASKFDDGTHIRFLNNPQSEREIVENIPPKCEGYFRNKFSIRSHGTPGIKETNEDNVENCSDIDITLL